MHHDKLPPTHVAALARQAEGDPQALVQLARLIAGDPEQQATLRSLVRQALALAPEDRQLKALAADLLSAQVAGWHFTIVQDERRNRDYEAAIRKAVAGRKVLDIGAGTGLLAMMAARAGAERVTSCEMNPAIAEAAERIVAANGLAGRVRVVGKHSAALSLEEDLGGGKVDVIVSETISNDVVSQGWLDSLADARARLAEPGAAVIPSATEMKVALAEDRSPLQSAMGDVAGFDLSPFNLHAPLRYQVRTGGDRIALRGPAETLARFDFRGDAHPQDFACDLVSDGGRVGGIAQWIAIEMDEEIVYENPPGEPSCWALLFYPFETVRETKPGERIRVAGRRLKDKIILWAE